MLPSLAVESDVPPLKRSKSPQGKVTGRLAEAIRLMVEEGLTYQDAAKAVGMHVRPLRRALDKPHVLSHLKQARQVFRAAVCSANDFRLAKVRDTSRNDMAVVNAVKALEQLDNVEQGSAARATSPGFVLVIGAGALTTHERSADAKPLIEQGSAILPPYDAPGLPAQRGPGGKSARTKDRW